MKCSCLLVAAFLLLIRSTVCAEGPIHDTLVEQHALTGVRIARGVVELPAKGWWMAADPFPKDRSLTEIYLKPIDDTPNQFEGDRQGRLADRRAIAARRQAIQQLYWACDQYALEREGLAPETLRRLLETKRAQGKWSYLGDGKTVEGIHLLGGIKIYEEANNRESRVKPVAMLAFDTTPAIDDGKHWVTKTTGQAQRVAIDPTLLQKHGVLVKPSQKPADVRLRGQSPTMAYHVYARLLGALESETLALNNLATKESLTVDWDLTDSKKGSGGIPEAWANLRAQFLLGDSAGLSPILGHWARQWQRQYGVDLSIFRQSNESNRGGETANAMGVLGGRAAIRETLQLRNLVLSAEGNTDTRYPIGDVKGVEVKSHPFEQMLADDPTGGGELPLADWVPRDRFMVYFPSPKGLFQLLEGGASFIHESGSTFTSRKAAYYLKARYLARLGLSEALMKQFLATGVIREMAVALPDLFLIDGTDLTVIARTKSPLLTSSALALLGIHVQGGQSVVKDNASGAPVVWTLKDDILVISSSQKESDHVFVVQDEGNSLGRSSEFRYMLGQVPVTAQTRVYAYFSDPFIRRLVGPEVKIGQMRRLMARAELEEASAAALLATFDGHRDVNVESLVAEKYLSPTASAGGLTLDDQMVSQSDHYGSVGQLATLGENVVTDVSEVEKKAYDTYLERYNRYWRRYFDPIAVRYEQYESGAHQLDTFILPLIDNSLYAGLKEVLAAEESATPLMVPTISPAPVAMLSLNLNEEAWLEMLDDFSEQVTMMLGIDGAILDQLGPDFHVAVHDADPVIGLGSGELQGLLGRFGGRIGSDMTMIPVMVSMLTRPTSFLIGLQDPDQVKQQLDRMAVPSESTGFMGFAKGSFYRVTGEEKWIFKFSVEDLISIRFGIEIQDRYLVVTNMPFSQPFEVTLGKLSANRAAHLTLSPQACQLQLPSLFASAVEKERATAMGSAACLTPLFISGLASTVAEAQTRHHQWFGFEPQHPAGGTWAWRSDGHLESSLYGTSWDQKQPSYDPENEKVGVMNRIADLDLSMQFEHDGLRSTVRWSLK